MLARDVVLGLALGYVLLVSLAWLLQERLAFPAPRAPVPDPRHLGLAHGERIALALGAQVRLEGWYLPPAPPPVSAEAGAPALLWFYGNGETIAAIAPVLRDFQPPGAALLAIDYPGYGGSAGRPTEAALYAAADVAYQALTTRPGVDPRRIFVYGRSLGSAVATHTAARHPVAGLVLESPFTSARAMAHHFYRVVPSCVLRLELDTLDTIARVRCPVLIFHGASDRLVPPAMGFAVAAAAAPGRVEVVLIPGAGHNETYAVGARAYRDKLWAFVGERA